MRAAGMLIATASRLRRRIVVVGPLGLRIAVASSLGLRSRMAVAVATRIARAERMLVSVSPVGR